ncbi:MULTISPECIES: STAS/SEC14 domain-containing protein [unclassified Roseovarius]|uniref:STAS/SEC14 domain-containing protein n=1 Tax=unclassified Roseovarius TaxID=2614913 RepID=UPI00273F1291|nr:MULTISPECIES: STAS/SEC14 domain-containing protein [unclassified Roseovarius]
MPNFHSGTVTEIATEAPDVYAFRFSGHLDDDTAEELAEYMNHAFDRHEKVNMLMDLTDFSGSDWDAILDYDVVRSRLRSLSHVNRYAVIGAQERAETMISIADKLLPVEAKAFDTSEADAAWAFVGTVPSKAA